MQETEPGYGVPPFHVDAFGQRRDIHGRPVDPNGRVLAASEIAPQKEPRPIGKALGPIAIAVIFLLKMGKFLLIPLKFLKFGKFFGTFATMFLSVLAYATLFGWKLAALFVLIIFVHEMGHYVTMRRYGLGDGAPVFIPFLGAFIAMKKHPPDAYTEAKVGIAGPIAGGVASIACLAVFAATQSPLWMAAANIGFLINLFNLLPVHPMDGARTLVAVSRKVRFWGMVALIPMLFLVSTPLFLVIALLGFLGLWQERRRPAEVRDRYYEVPTKGRVLVAVAYFGTAIVLGWGWAYSDGILQTIIEHIPRS